MVAVQGEECGGEGAVVVEVVEGGEGPMVVEVGEVVAGAVGICATDS